jgi:enoyl-CoA hydratase/carnithine racemase
MSDLVKDIHPPIARVTINRPDRRNAISSAMWQELAAIAVRLHDDPTIKIVVITGAGDAAFSAGADILEMQQGLADPPRMKVMQQAVLDAQVAWERLPIPTLAVIRGACTGGGCGLALACDLRLATPDAFFAIPPAKLGLAYSLADTKRLHDLVGPSRTKEILYTGRRILAEEALALGLINEIVAAEALDERAVTLARELGTRRQSRGQHDHRRGTGRNRGVTPLLRREFLLARISRRRARVHGEASATVLTG